MNHTSAFDLDLEYGQIGEKELADILAGKIEVKTERGKWKDTGNIAVEYSSRGKSSGILVTKAEYWCTILKDDEGNIENIILTPIAQMKKLFRKYFTLGNKVKGGDDNTSEIVLIPLKELFIDDWDYVL